MPRNSKEISVTSDSTVTVTPTVAPNTVLSLVTEISSLSFLDCFYASGLIQGSVKDSTPSHTLVLLRL